MNKKLTISKTPANLIMLAFILSFFLAKISYESSANISNKEFLNYFAILPASLFSYSNLYRIFTAPFVTLGYWEVFVYIFYILVIAKNSEITEGTIKLIRIFIESYILFILFSFLFFKNFYISGLWFYVFNVMWFYLNNQPDHRLFKYGYPVFCIIYAILVLQSGKTDYWKLGHLSGVICVYLDGKLTQLLTSLTTLYKIKKKEKFLDYNKNMEKQVDNILEKIYKLGYNSLTKGEKEILQKASKIYKDKFEKEF